MKASVKSWNAFSKKWLPSGDANIHICHHTVSNTYRVLGRKLKDHEVNRMPKVNTTNYDTDPHSQLVVNFPIRKGLKYNRATGLYHYGVERYVTETVFFWFTKDDEEVFTSTMLRVMEVSIIFSNNRKSELIFLKNVQSYLNMTNLQTVNNGRTWSSRAALPEQIQVAKSLDARPALRPLQCNKNQATPQEGKEVPTIKYCLTIAMEKACLVQNMILEKIRSDERDRQEERRRQHEQAKLRKMIRSSKTSRSSLESYSTCKMKMAAQWQSSLAFMGLPTSKVKSAVLHNSSNRVCEKKIVIKVKDDGTVKTKFEHGPLMTIVGKVGEVFCATVASTGATMHFTMTGNNNTFNGNLSNMANTTVNKRAPNELHNTS